MSAEAPAKRDHVAEAMADAAGRAMRIERERCLRIVEEFPWETYGELRMLNDLYERIKSAEGAGE